MTADHPVRPWFTCSGNPCTCVKPQSNVPERKASAWNWGGTDMTPGREAPAPEPPELVVERVAQALCDGDAADHGTYDWAEADGELQDDYRRAARHAIAAMEEI